MYFHRRPDPLLWLSLPQPFMGSKDEAIKLSCPEALLMRFFSETDGFFAVSLHLPDVPVVYSQATEES